MYSGPDAALGADLKLVAAPAVVHAPAPASSRTPPVTPRRPPSALQAPAPNEQEKPSPAVAPPEPAKPQPAAAPPPSAEPESTGHKPDTKAPESSDPPAATEPLPEWMQRFGPFLRSQIESIFGPMGREEVTGSVAKARTKKTKQAKKLPPQSRPPVN